MPRYHVAFNSYPRTDDASEEVTAHKMHVSDQVLLFYVDGRIVYTIAPGIWAKVKEIEEPDLQARQARDIVPGDICQCGHDFWSHSNVLLARDCSNANCKCDTFILQESPNDETQDTKA